MGGALRTRACCPVPELLRGDGMLPTLPAQLRCLAPCCAASLTTETVLNDFEWNRPVSDPHLPIALTDVRIEECEHLLLKPLAYVHFHFCCSLQDIHNRHHRRHRQTLNRALHPSRKHRKRP